jgi:hypothetical protein
MTLNQQDLRSISSASGIKQFTLAFIVANGGNACTPSWGGVIPVGSSGDYVKAAIDSLRRAGGDVIVSFGGEAGTELASTCSSAAALESAYQTVVDSYGAYNLDFDIEGGAVWDTTSISRRSQALALLQQAEARAGHSVQVSLTLPVASWGFPTQEVSVIRSAVTAGVTVSIVNPMTMDYGDGDVANPAGQMGAIAIQATKAVEAQLAQVYPTRSAAQLWAMIGITPLIGQNDIQDEVFTVADATAVARFATSQGVGRVAMWSVTRDKQCSQGVVTYDDPTCSGIMQSAWAFSHAFGA